MAKTRQINVPIPSDMFTRAKKCAQSVPMFFKAWIELAIKEKVQRDERKAAQ